MTVENRPTENITQPNQESGTIKVQTLSDLAVTRLALAADAFDEWWNTTGLKYPGELTDNVTIQDDRQTIRKIFLEAYILGNQEDRVKLE